MSKKQTIKLTVNELIDIIRTCVSEEIEGYHCAEQMLSEFSVPFCEIVNDNLRQNVSSTLNESLSLFKGYNTLLKDIEKVIKNRMYNGLYETNNTTYRRVNVTIYNFFITDKDINVNGLFFNKLNLSLSLIRINQHLLSDVTNLTNGSYTPNDTLYDNKLPLVTIKAQCPFLGNDFMTYLRGAILHEFTHAYEDYNKLLKLQQNKRVRTLQDYSDNEYNQYQLLINDKSQIKRTLGSIMYHFSNTEKNAYIAQMYGDLSTIPYAEICKKDTYSLLQRTSTWRRFVVIQNNINRIANDLGISEEFDNEVLDTINNVKLGKRFNTAETAIKWLQKQFQYTTQHMIEHFGRTVKQYILDHEHNDINEMFAVLGNDKSFGLTKSNNG